MNIEILFRTRFAIRDWICRVSRCDKGRGSNRRQRGVLNSKTRHAWRLRRCQSTFSFCHSGPRRSFPFCLKGHASSCPNPFNTYICIMYTNEHAGAPKGRAGFPCHKSYTYSRESSGERKGVRDRRHKGAILLRNGATLRLTRISFVFCTVIIFSLSSLYRPLISVAPRTLDRTPRIIPLKIEFIC